ncbi:MAG: L-ribulose-5-phosphate 3-epimerase [Treponema sp.]|jgi:L-ribulose-5-phosphate 3-epimerase|nr:L-ribulose-5-phosphate 3-epimerase [Treponema sp.]
MQRFRIGIYEKAMPHSLSWGEKFAAAAAAGYDFIEISIDETDEKLARLKMGRAERLELRRRALEAGLPVGTMCLSGHRKYPLGSEDPAVRSRSLAIMEDAIAFAGDLGIRIIQLAGYDEYYGESNERTRDLFYDGLAASVEMAAAAGVILAFETMETEFMNTVEKAMAYVERIDSPYLQVYPDCGNLTNAARARGADELADLRRGRGHLAALHLKETLPGKFREIPYGEGHVNFEAIIATALELRVGLFVTEYWYTGQPDYRELVHGSKAFIDRKFAAVRGTIL